MRTSRNILLFALILISNQSFAQQYIPYLPEDQIFIGSDDLVDESVTTSISCQLLNIKDNKEVPVSETALARNSTNQIYYYRFIDLVSDKNSFEAMLNYEDPFSNPIQSIEISNPKTDKILEKWNYEYGTSLVERIEVNRYLPGAEKPEVFEIRYEDNDTSIQETIYTPKKAILQQTKIDYHYLENEGYHKVRKKYINDPLTLVQIDSAVHNRNYLKQADYQTKNNKITETKYTYGVRKIETDEEDYYQKKIESVQVNGKDTIRYEYEYDENDNWNVRKTFEMKNGKWEYSSVIKRTITYTM